MLFDSDKLQHLKIPSYNLHRITRLDAYYKDAINIKYRVRTLRSSRGNVKKR